MSGEVNEVVKALLTTKVTDAEYHVKQFLDDALLSELPTEYRQRVIAASAEGALWLAAAAAGDHRAEHELQIVSSRMALWTWAGAQRARNAMVRALKRWLYEATELLVKGATAALELGLRALVNSGLDAISEAT